MANGDRARQGAMGALVAAWLITSVYYFYQYVMRSSPSVMMPQLTDAFGMSAVGLASLLGLFYYGYAPFSLVAGVAMDQLGPRKVVPLGAAMVGVGALLFASGDPTLAAIGRFIQGAAGVFALIGAVYIATTYFPASRAATLIGVTQMFGMAGGSAGQFVVGPLIPMMPVKLTAMPTRTMIMRAFTLVATLRLRKLITKPRSVTKTPIKTIVVSP